MRFDLDSTELADRIHQRIDHVQVQSSSPLAPALAYGRHRGPIPETARVAAVAVAMYQHATIGWVIPLTLRPVTLNHHGGQICFPGGQAETDESMLEAAVREYTEELGVVPNVQVVCGELATHFVFASENRVHPVVMIIEPPATDWQPDPVEVAEVILMPLMTLVDSSERIETVQEKAIAAKDGTLVGNLQFRAPALKVGNQQVWGATAMILEQLAQILH